MKCSRRLPRLLASRQPQEVQLAALATLGRFKQPQVAQMVLAAWSGFSPRVRTEAVELLFARPERLALLLEAIEEGKVSPTEIDPARIKQLTAHPKLGERATKAFASVQLARRGDVVEAYRSALSMPGDRERGREVFKKICAACHKLDGMGHEVGPNLAAMQNRGPEAILVNVLDPNREVNPQYVNYVLLTDDGRSLTGMIAAETATSVTLKRAEGAKRHRAARAHRGAAEHAAVDHARGSREANRSCRRWPICWPTSPARRRRPVPQPTMPMPPGKPAWPRS